MPRPSGGSQFTEPVHPRRAAYDLTRRHSERRNLRKGMVGAPWRDEDGYVRRYRPKPRHHGIWNHSPI